MRSRRAIGVRWLAVFAAGAAIFFASDRSVPIAPVPLFPHADKVLHALAYAAFTALVLRALWADETRAVPAGVLVLGAALAAAYGVTDELHQHGVPGRSCDFFDWLADASGASLMALAWTPLTKRFVRLK